MMQALNAIQQEIEREGCGVNFVKPGKLRVCSLLMELLSVEVVYWGYSARCSPFYPTRRHF